MFEIFKFQISEFRLLTSNFRLLLEKNEVERDSARKIEVFAVSSFYCTLRHAQATFFPWMDLRDDYWRGV